MKRLCIILLLLAGAGINLSAQEKSYPRITFGAEWGYIGVFYSGYHYNFYAPEGYRVDPRNHEFMYDSNAEAYLHAGYNINEYYNISLYAGFSAVEDYHHTIPISLRLTKYYGNDHLNDRWLTFVDLGSGLCLKKKPQEILTGKIGAGYRISLSRHSKLDIIFSLRTVLTHPDIVYYDTEIDRKKINRNNAYISAASIGMALTF